MTDKISPEIKNNKCISKKRKKATLRSEARGNAIFYCLMVLFPLTQFAIFYVGVNFNSFLLAFKEYDMLTGKSHFVGFENITKVIHDICTKYELIMAVKNSLIAYVCGLVVGLPLALFFSYYIYKKMFLHNFYKVVLFLPSILSAIAMSIIFYYFVEKALPEYMEKLFNIHIRGLLTNPKTALASLIFYSNWISFSTNILMYSGAMNSIPYSVVEAAQLDGITPFKEFIHITLPLIYPTLVTFLVVGVAGIFTNQLNIYSLMGTGAETYLYTFGYYLYRGTSIAQISDYPYLSSMGLLMTLVAAPITLIVKYLLEKLGPKAD